MITKRFFIALAAAALASCGQSGNSDNTTAQPDQQEQNSPLTKAMGSMRGVIKADNPVEYSYSVSDLEGHWTCSTESGDLTDYFGIDIQPVSDNEIMFVNFHNLGKNIKATVDGNRIAFSGQLTHEFTLTDCDGTIDKSYSQMTLTYSLVDEDGEKDDFKISLTKGNPMATPAPL